MFKNCSPAEDQPQSFWGYQVGSVWHRSFGQRCRCMLTGDSLFWSCAWRQLSGFLSEFTSVFYWWHTSLLKNKTKSKGVVSSFPPIFLCKYVTRKHSAYINSQFSVYKSKLYINFNSQKSLQIIDHLGINLPLQHWHENRKVLNRSEKYS